VRHLAQRCARASAETAFLIEETILKSSTGKTKVDAIAITIHEITAESARIQVFAEEVKMGSGEQAKGLDQIGRAISQMEIVTQSTAANAQQSAAMAQQLSAQSGSLLEVVAQLNAMVAG
jgi:methyl-accepting chemotaxis protein